MSEGIYIHPTSEISPEARIGRGTKVWQHCTVLAGAEIGEGCLLSQNVYIEGRTRIGSNVKIKNNVSIYECVELEDDVFAGPSAVFTNVLTPRSHWPRKDQFLKTLVRKGATIGANATIVCGVTIGRYAMVGAGSVVTRDVPDFALVYGVPAKQHGWACQCGTLIGELEDGATYCCDLCGSTYELWHGVLAEIHLCFV
jgi:UDP-2-acetamido-3-amino-2,3-dideoxy-glucuronate N-acetyltransferase